MKRAPRSTRPFASRFVATLLALASLAVPARATWSIVVVNTRTGEVAVGTATCIPRFHIEDWVPVIVVGRGAGAAQANGDNGAVARQIMFAAIQAGMTPDQVMQALFDGLD